MTDRIKNILIGLFVVGALSIGIALVLFLKPSTGDGKRLLEVRFSNIAGITVGTRVTFAGKPVGQVLKIQTLPEARDMADEQGKIYLYQLTLKVDSGVHLYNTDEVAIRATGLMGERSIAILPKVSIPGKTALVGDQIVYANSSDPLEGTFNQVTKTAARLETAINRLDQWFDINQNQLAHLVQSFDGAAAEFKGLVGTVNGENLVSSIHESVRLLNQNMLFVKASLQDDHLLHRLAGLTESLDQMANTFNTDGAALLHNLNQVSRDIASGTGTIGRLLAGDDLYLRVASLMNKGETLMNDINHYGILFQYNKQWQKGRTRKANLVKSLDTPQEFRNYFEGEVDSMTTAIGRLSELMERVGREERSKLVQSDAFKKDFAHLMRQTQGLSDSLKLYNEGMIADSEVFDE